jgi:hypothetical protein
MPGSPIAMEASAATKLKVLILSLQAVRLPREVVHVVSSSLIADKFIGNPCQCPFFSMMSLLGVGSDHDHGCVCMGSRANVSSLEIPISMLDRLCVEFVYLCACISIFFQDEIRFQCCALVLRVV